MAELTLLRQGSRLADASQQLDILASALDLPRFAHTLADHDLPPLRAAGIQVLQVNVGKLCNQTCRHCHVDAGPDRREIMTRETAEAVLDVLANSDIPTLDITGGAPEMNPNFRWLASEARRLGRHVIDRTNLTILLMPGFDDLPEFLASLQVEIVASLPCYLEENCDRQRGDGVFRRSIQALQRLNSLGYGHTPQSDHRVPGSERSDGPARPSPVTPSPCHPVTPSPCHPHPLTLTLVYNPLTPSLPPPQDQLEDDYRRELRTRYGVEFTRLHTITNMPISRFLDDLLRSGQYDAYMHKLLAAFNPAAVDGVMCRTTLSVDWQGYLYDCDFNQMLDLPLARGLPRHIRDFDLSRLEHRPIVTAQHCYGCTAAAGSSCQGALVPNNRCPP